jgi:hypothetical protein
MKEYICNLVCFLHDQERERLGIRNRFNWVDVYAGKIIIHGFPKERKNGFSIKNGFSLYSPAEIREIFQASTNFIKVTFSLPYLHQSLNKNSAVMPAPSAGNSGASSPQMPQASSIGTFYLTLECLYRFACRSVYSARL